MTSEVFIKPRFYARPCGSTTLHWLPMFSQEATGLKLTLPEKAPNEYAYGFIIRTWPGERWPLRPYDALPATQLFHN